MIKSKVVGAALAALSAAVAFADAGVAPETWRSVSTNEIASWNAAHGVKDGVVVDRTARTVTFLAEAACARKADPIEFLLIGPYSDRAYEAFAVSAATPAAIAAALDSIGVPRGRPVDPRNSRFWPQGERVAIKAKRLADGAEFALADMLDDARAADERAVLDSPPVYTGGVRDASDSPVASTNMPCAIFALYSHSTSLLQFDGTFDQSGVYGRFKTKLSCKVGELFEFTLSYDGKRSVEEKTIHMDRNANLRSILNTLRERAGTALLHASLSFAPDMPLADAARMAQAFALVDGAGVRMNGAAPGQFFYRAFLPDDAWRRREGRIYQPFEVHVASDGSRKFVFVEEDYSGEGLDPILKPHETQFGEWRELSSLIARTKADKVNVMFIYAPAHTPVGDLRPIIDALSDRIATFYLFAEESK